MRIAAVVLTHNAYKHERCDLLLNTIASLRDGANDHTDIYVIDNGSTDGTEKLVAELGGLCARDENTTSGHGSNLSARVACGTNAQIAVHSDDDMVWSTEWADQLDDWWTDAPNDVVLTGCHLEPEYPWNTIIGTLEVAGRRGLDRISTGAASWSYRTNDYHKIFPIPEQRQGWGDVPACQRLKRNSYRIAQIDLAHHAGRHVSTWGNPPNDGVELNKERWGLP